MKIYDGRSSFYQWDVNQKLTTPDFAEGDEIHFYNVTLSRALVVKAYALGNDIVADVPNILLQKPLEIKAYKYTTEGNSNATRAEFSFPVLKRPKPDDYVYTDTEILTVRDYVNAAMLEAKESGEFDGKDGTGILSITANEAGKLVITLETGASVVIDIPTVRGEDGKDGVDGRDGADGADGISPIISTAPIENGHKITFTDAEGTHIIDLFNGKDGKDGVNGVDGKDGVNGKDGTNGKDGINGKDGANGKDGYTPQKYVDYYTEADISEMVQSVLVALPDNREVAY